MKKMILEIDGDKVHVTAERVNGQLWVHYRGRILSKDTPEARGSREQKKLSKPDRIEAPMPGKILKVQATKGAFVKAGDVLVIMEAMKMEYSLKAEVKGKVKAVHAQVGDQVSQGKCLLELDIS